MSCKRPFSWEHLMYLIDGAHLSINYLGQLAAATLDIKASLEKIIKNKILHVCTIVRTLCALSYGESILVYVMNRNFERIYYEY